MNSRCRFLIFFVLFPFTLICQNQNLKFEHITTLQGLSQSNVTKIIQDSRGFMWFGTRDGLNKYDGYKFKVYKNNPDDPKSIGSNDIMDLIEDSEGNIWATTWEGGLNRYDRNADNFVRYNFDRKDTLSLWTDAVHCVVEGDEGNLWVGTHLGLNVFNKQTEKFKKIYLFKNAHADDNRIPKLLKDFKGNMWVGTKNGLYHLDLKTDKKSYFEHDPIDAYSISSNDITAIFEDSKKNIWIGTNGGGLCLYNSSSKSFKSYKNSPSAKNSLAYNVVLSLEEDEEGNIWVGTENGGLSIFNPKTGNFNSYKNNGDDNTSLSNNSIYSIYRDKKGNMWVGTYSGGINFLNKDSNKFYHYKSNSATRGLSNNSISCFYEDSKGNLWIGTDGGGLNLFDRKTGEFKVFKHEKDNVNSICGNHLISISEDSEGNLWIGTYGDGVTMFNFEKNTFRHFKNDPQNQNSLGTNHAWTIYEDRNKNIWVGTFGKGLALLDKKTSTFTHYRNIPGDTLSLSDNLIHTISEDSDGNLIVGTTAGGFNIFNPKTGEFKSYKHDKYNTNSLSNNNINCIYQDSLGNFWISTQSGLNYWERKNNKFSVFSTKEGLPSNKIWGILDDGKGNLWISTNDGLSKFNTETKKFRNYSITDGLQSNEFSKAFLKSKAGKMYFGGINGFNEFHPDSIRENHPYEPNLVITDFQVLNRPVKIDVSGTTPLTKHISETKELVLSPEQSVFSFEFATLNYVDLKSKRYAYILEGFDKDWNYVGTNHYVTYTNLDPGTYTLRLKGLNNQGKWSKNTKELIITIVPPFWKTNWFRILVGLIFSFLIALVLKIRISIIRRQKEELEEKVELRTQELQQSNSELREVGEEIFAQREKIEELYNGIKDSIRAAQVIQNSILPSTKLIKKFLPESFILHRPKDLVSGDFYWFDAIGDKIIIAVADCTGHGVSGAFMSINGHHLLNQAIYSEKNLDAAEILNRLNKGIIKELHNNDQNLETFDGMDIALCIIDREQMKLQYAGANNPLYVSREKEIIQYKANKYSIGLSLSGEINTFDSIELEVQKGDIFYMFSDGYADQIGGEENGKFMYSKFRELLTNIREKNMNDQQSELENAFNDWKGENEQLDDILVMGFKID